MANIGREMQNRPSASVSWGRGIGQESLKALPNQKELSALKAYLKEQNPTGKSPILKIAAKDIILTEDTINVFFDKLAEFSETMTSNKSSIGSSSSKGFGGGYGKGFSYNMKSNTKLATSYMPKSSTGTTKNHLKLSTIPKLT